MHVFPMKPQISIFSMVGLFVIMLVILLACQEKQITPAVAASKGETSPANSALEHLSGRILFQSDRNGSWDIYVMNADGSHLVQLTNDPADEEYPVWSPNGRQIAFESNRDGNYDIYVMNADGSEQRRVTDSPAQDKSPAWSPDGRQILFDSDREPPKQLYIMDADGGRVRPFHRAPGDNILPDWSPDGRRIAYTGNRDKGWNVYAIQVDESQEIRLTNGYGACRPDWSPDGGLLAYVSKEADEHGDIWLVSPDGNNRQRLTTDAQLAEYYPAWSPDGRYLVYAASPDKQKGNWELNIISADGSERMPLGNHPANEKFPDWSSGSVPEAWVLQQQFIYEAEQMPRTVGAVRDDAQASKGLAAYAEAAAPSGFLMYGPYRWFAPAKYVANFRLKAENIGLDDAVALIEVSAEQGNRSLMQTPIQARDFKQAGRYQEFQLVFSLTEQANLEFRVHFLGKTGIWVDNVTISPVTVF